MIRTFHPDKDIEKALRIAEEHGWRIERGGSHARALLRVVANCQRRKPEP